MNQILKKHMCSYSYQINTVEKKYNIYLWHVVKSIK